MTTREEHLQWCKDRAIEYAKNGDMANAWASFRTDMSQHQGTATNPGLQLGDMMLVGGQLRTSGDIIKFLNDFN